jgi:hypothetical protein
VCCQGGPDAFQKGAVSQFYRSTVKLGQLKTVLLCIDGKKTGTWRPELLEVVDTKLNKVRFRSLFVARCTRHVTMLSELSATRECATKYAECRIMPTTVNVILCRMAEL